MNKLLKITSIFAFVVLLGSVFFAQSCKSEDKTKLNKNLKMERPKYEITVKQKGQVLGKIEIELFTDIAPKHCHNFDSLVSIGFYDGLAFHRVIPGFMIQGGGPNSKNGPKDTWGNGAPGQTKVPAEFNATSHKRGILSAARSNDPNSATSQFFICTSDAPALDGKYTAYGEVISGMDVADKVVNAPRDARDNPIDKIEMYIKKIK